MTQEIQNTNSGMSTNKNTITLNIPKLNVQIIVLSLVAIITLFQTFQLMRISSKITSGSIKTSTSTVAPSSGASNNSAAPQSMVGGC